MEMFKMALFVGLLIAAIICLSGCSTTRHVAKFCTSEGEHREIEISARDGNTDSIKCKLGDYLETEY